jgi:1-deoxy-D-xylulose-5-phosphate reductoisomerase
MWPERVESNLRFDLRALRRLDFCAPDFEKFPCLRLAYEAAEQGGCKTIALNAADEVAVASFLAGEIAFTDIPVIVSEVLSETASREPESIKEVLLADVEARSRAKAAVRSLGGVAAAPSH